MKEMLKSKVMVCFMVFVLGVVYANACATEKLEEDLEKSQHDMITMHIQ